MTTDALTAAQFRNLRSEYMDACYRDDGHNPTTARKATKQYANQTLVPLAFPVGAKVTTKTFFRLSNPKTNQYTIAKTHKDGTIVTTSGTRFRVKTFTNIVGSEHFELSLYGSMLDGIQVLDVQSQLQASPEPAGQITLAF